MSRIQGLRKKLQSSFCPFDDAIMELRSGLQDTPRWLNSVRKFPPEKMYLTPGKVPRPSEFWGDRIRQLVLKNRRRPDWVPSLHASTTQTANIMAGAHFQEAFSTPTHGFEADIEFAACQAWFMHHKKLKEDEAYEQARFRMRDLIKQKQRIWEVYRRTKLLNEEERRKLRLGIAEEWTVQVNKLLEPILDNQMKTKKGKSGSEFVEDNAYAKNEKKNSPKESSQSVVPYNTHNTTDNTSVNNEREEHKFNAEWEDKIKLVRFIEYTDYIAKNPHLGLKDPTELLLGVPKNIPERDEVRRRLLLQMARKDKRLKYLQNK